MLIENLKYKVKKSILRNSVTVNYCILGVLLSRLFFPCEYLFLRKFNSSSTYDFMSCFFI